MGAAALRHHQPARRRGRVRGLPGRHPARGRGRAGGAAAGQGPGQPGRPPAWRRRGTAPLLLNGHVDVVAAEAGRWRHPPFAGEVHDGAVWGRGAVDMKQMVAMSVATVGLLARLAAPAARPQAGRRRRRGGRLRGRERLAGRPPPRARVRAGHASGGGRRGHLLPGRPALLPGPGGREGIAWLRAAASGANGHGSIPCDDNAVVRLSEFLASGRAAPPLHVSPEVRRFLEALAPPAGPPRCPCCCSPAGRTWSCGAGSATRGWSGCSARCCATRPARPWSTPGARSTSSPAGPRPTDGRIAVGSSEAEPAGRAWWDLAGPGIELSQQAEPPADGDPARRPAVRPAGRVVAEHHPGAVAVPTVTPGFTDAKFWSQLARPATGSPCPAGAGRPRLRRHVPRRRRARPRGRPQGRPADAGRRRRPPPSAGR